MTLSEIAIVLAVIAVAALWLMLPFSLFGVKRRLDNILSGQQRGTETLVTEMRRMNDLLHAVPEAPEGRRPEGELRGGWRSPSYRGVESP